jgi:two-component system sensor histidine kinase RegB
MSVSTAHIAAGRDPEAATTATPVRKHAHVPDRANVNLSWLVQLHWTAIVGQVVAIAAAWRWSGVDLPLQPLAALVLVEVAGNIGLSIWARRGRVTDAGVTAVMIGDVVVLTVLLDLTGGASNPFTAVYLVYVALAAVLLPQRWAWALTVASMAGFGGLYWHERASGRAHHIAMRLRFEDLADEYLRIVWVGFAVASVSIVFFVQRISTALAQRERELEEARARAVRRERLASLATLAAGAAHELATPLGTIAIVAKELLRSAPSDVSQDMRADLQMIRDQVARCRDILDRMSANAGETAGEPLQPLGVQAWIDAALENFPDGARVVVEGTPEALTSEVLGPPRALADMLRGLFKNAVHASPEGAPVGLRVALERGRVRATVTDRGRGMSPDVLGRVGEPFYTTKGPGEGMGLGLFLTRALAEQLGGDFRIASHPGQGTEATLELPAWTGERKGP